MSKFSCTIFSVTFRYFTTFILILLLRRLFSFEHFEILAVSTMMKFMAAAIRGLSGNKAFISLVNTFFLSFFY